MKTLTIKQITLSESEQEYKCSTCCLNTSSDCTRVKLWLKTTYGFKDCSLGVNYQGEYNGD